MADDTVGIFEEDAGIFFTEKCVVAYLRLAKENGAEILGSESVLSFSESDDRIVLGTNRDSYISDKLILTAGPWISSLVPQLKNLFQAERQILFRIRNKVSFFENPPADLRVYKWEFKDDEILYGFPDLGNGLKVANPTAGTDCHPDTVDREASEEEKRYIVTLVERYMHINPIVGQAAVCMYKNTKDGHFLIDYHPDGRHVVLQARVRDMDSSCLLIPEKYLQPW